MGIFGFGRKKNKDQTTPVATTPATDSGLVMAAPTKVEAPTATTPPATKTTTRRPAAKKAPAKKPAAKAATAAKKGGSKKK